MKRHHVPGLSLAVVRGDKVLKLEGYGVAELERNTPVTAWTCFEIGSVTKPITATAIMMLVERGRLNLSDHIGDHLPDVPAHWKHATVYQLLAHTSGIGNYTDMMDFPRLAATEFAPGQVIELASTSPLTFESGSQWRYSNTGYYLLGLLIEKLSGLSYWQFLHRNMFEPLGMRTTQSARPQPASCERAAGYAWSGEGSNAQHVAQPAVTESAGFAAGSLMSSAVDISTWMTALAAGKLVDSKSLQLMWTPARIHGRMAASVAYGLGWFTGRFSGLPVAAHGGGSPGFSSQLVYFRDQDLTVVVLANRSDFDTHSLARDVAAFFVPQLNWHSALLPEDPAPELTRKVVRALSGFASGHPEPSLFAPQAKALLKPDSRRELAKARRARGPVKSLAYVGRDRIDRYRIHRYKVAYGASTELITATFEPDGRIVSLRADEIDR
jgi:CubicO group peptidase (beta-lactamase class C family)